MPFGSRAESRPYSALRTVGMEPSVLGKKDFEEEAGFSRAVGERAARFRKERGITQKEMAERLGVSQPHVSFYERGETRLHAEMLAKVARILRVSADELLGIKTPKSPDAASAAMSAKSRRLLQQVSELPERDQRAVVRLIRSLVSSKPA
jgi:transcriptional regulator with XRE-family HTH domain